MGVGKRVVTEQCLRIIEGLGNVLRNFRLSSRIIEDKDFMFYPICQFVINLCNNTEMGERLVFAFAIEQFPNNL